MLPLSGKAGAYAPKGMDQGEWRQQALVASVGIADLLSGYS